MAEIKGMKELRVNVGKLTKEIQEVLPTALKAGALLIQNDGKKRATFRTGTLRRSIHTEDVSNTEVRVGTDVEYAPYLEYGTKKMTARPYLRPAMDENREKVIDKVKAVIQALIK